MKLTYFKPGGKYYAQGDFVSPYLHQWEIVWYVQDLRDKGKLPGLVEGSKKWHIYIDPSEGIPHLLVLPKEMS